MDNNQIVERLDLFRCDIQELKMRLGKISYSQERQSKMAPETLAELHKIRTIFRDGSYDIFNRERDVCMDVIEIKPEFANLPVTHIILSASETIENLFNWSARAMSDAQDGEDSGYISVHLKDSREELSKICHKLSDYVTNERSKPIESDIQPLIKTKDQKTPPQKEPELDGEIRALACLTKHPGWSKAQIAREIGVNRTTLYEYPLFMEAVELLKEGKSDMPRGSKNGEHGDVEAWE